MFRMSLAWFVHPSVPSDLFFIWQFWNSAFPRLNQDILELSYPSFILSGSFVSERGSHRRGSPGVALGLGIKAGGAALSCEPPRVSPSAKQRPAAWPCPEQARGSFPDTPGTWHVANLLENISYQAFTWENSPCSLIFTDICKLYTNVLFDIDFKCHERYWN